MIFRDLVLAAIILLVSLRTLACASCGCNVMSDVDPIKEAEASLIESWKFDLRYDYLNQNQLRSGVSTISQASAAAYQSYNQEVEGYTVNNYLTFNVQHDWEHWALRLVIPMIQRGHSTNGNAAGDTTWNGALPDAGGGAYTSNTSGLGDVRLSAVTKNILGINLFSFNFGLKLPTGNTHQTGLSTDSTSPGGVAVDPGLQLGTGTTDLFYGLDYARNLAVNWTGFVQAQFQTSLKPVNNYRPGDSFNFNIGARYCGYHDFTPTAQINSRRVLTDSGSAADQVSTGGTLIYFTPGISEPWGATGSLYQMIQIPVYQFVYGVQLDPQYVISAGIQYSL